MRIDMQKHRELQEQGLIAIQQHPDLPLLIHNYTKKCQWSKTWNETTVICRGLITDLSGYVVSRPFPKFFNLGEHSAESGLPLINWSQSFHVTEKLDGSLGIVYPGKDKFCIATRGSFVSDQAVRGTEMLQRLRNSSSMSVTYTHLFEIIYPENKIVVDYGRKEALVLLDMIDVETGKSIHPSSLEDEARRLGCEVAAKHSFTREDLRVLSSDETNREGVVVRFADGTRVKIKLPEYCRLHKLLTGVNTKTLWEALKDGKSIDYLLENVPDEFFEWTMDRIETIRLDYYVLDCQVKNLFSEIKGCLNCGARKDYAEQFRKHPQVASILFLMLDGKDFSQAIWKQIKPQHVSQFASADE